MLELVNCQVLSIVESEHVDAYLLSESSMFVSPHKLILKTCGTTTLLCGLPRILEIAALVAKFPHTNGSAGTIAAAAVPYRVFYSRKNFLFPDRQKGPHRSWRDEVKSLDRLFLGGSAYMIGKMNGEHWYLYLTEPNTILTPPATPERCETETKVMDLPAAAARLSEASDEADETLEILMTDLDETTSKQFYFEHATSVAESRLRNPKQHADSGAHDHLNAILKSASDADLDVPDMFDNVADTIISSPTITSEGHALGSVVSDMCGLSDVYPSTTYPEARIDAYLFTPCGFSANGVIPAVPSSDGIGGAGHYFTVHVTPEPHCSFASFESNVPAARSGGGSGAAATVEQVVRIFRPGRFSVTLFETTPADGRTVRRTSTRMDSIPGYRRVERIVHDLEGYELVFLYYERWDWEGGAPRLGEFVD